VRHGFPETNFRKIIAGWHCPSTETVVPAPPGTVLAPPNGRCGASHLVPTHIFGVISGKIIDI
jgi:hypothetical protein